MAEYQVLRLLSSILAFAAMFCFYMAGKKAGRYEVNKILEKERRYIKRLEAKLWSTLRNG